MNLNYLARSRKSPLTALALSLSLSTLGALSACGGGDGGVPSTSEGSSIMTSSVQTVKVVNEGGGFTPQPPAGSTCLVGGRKFDLTMATQSLSWSLCVGDGVMPYREMTGGRVLSSTEFKDLTELLEKLKVVKATGACIADAPMLSVTVRTALAEQQYVDDGFQCSVKDKPYLERIAINNVLTKLETFTK